MRQPPSTVDKRLIQKSMKKYILLIACWLCLVSNVWAQRHRSYFRRKAPPKATYVGLWVGAMQHSGHVLIDEGKVFAPHEQVHWLGSVGLAIGHYMVNPSTDKKSINRHWRVGIATGLEWQPVRLDLVNDEVSALKVGKTLPLVSVPLLLKLGWLSDPYQGLYVELRGGVRLNRVMGQSFATDQTEAQDANSVPWHVVWRANPQQENFLSVQLSAETGKRVGRLELGIRADYIRYLDSFYALDAFYAVSTADYQRVQLTSPTASLGVRLGAKWWF